MVERRLKTDWQKGTGLIYSPEEVNVRFGTILPKPEGQSTSALPCSSDVDLFRRGLAEQKAYVRWMLDPIAAATGVRSTDRSSPSVYTNGDTMQTMAAEA
jgi:hypothetical protein